MTELMEHDFEHHYAKINQVDEITHYVPEDTDLTSQLFQLLKRLGGMCVTSCCLPCVPCGCGPIFTVPEGYRAAVLTFGKLTAVKPPGVYALNVGSEDYQLISVQVQTMKLAKQCVITKDGIQIKIDAVCFYRVVDVEKAMFSVAKCATAIYNLACYTLEVMLGEHTLEDLLQNRDTIAERVISIVEEKTQEWGVHIIGIEIRDIDLPKALIRVMASGAEASREGQAKIITAQAELEAAEAYGAASKVLAESPGAMQLRYLQTLTEIAAEQNSTIILPGDLCGAASSILGSMSSSKAID